MSAFDFDLTVREVPITLDGKSYTLRELDGASHAKFQSLMQAAVIFGPDGKPIGMTDVGDKGAHLIALCLFDADGVAVPVEVAAALPARVQNPLVKKIREMSELDMNDTEAGKAKAKETLKNAPGSTMTGSTSQSG